MSKSTQLTFDTVYLFGCACKGKVEKNFRRCILPVMKAELSPYYTQAELARKAGVSRGAVGKAIRHGLLATVETMGGTPLVHRNEAERWLRERRPPGRPRETKGRKASHLR